MGNGFLLVAVGLLILYVGVSGKLDCVTDMFSCLFGGQPSQAQKTSTGGFFGSLGGVVGKGVGGVLGGIIKPNPSGGIQI